MRYRKDPDLWIAAILFLLILLIIAAVDLFRGGADASAKQTAAVTSEKTSENTYALLAFEPAEPAEPAKPEPSAVEPAYDLSEREKRLISATAWNSDHTNDESLTCVVKTILNRVESPKFPDSVEDVLRQKGQFENCDRVLYDKTQYDFDRVAELIDEVCEGYDPFEGEVALFYSAVGVNPSKIARGLTLVKTVGGTNFYRQD